MNLYPHPRPRLVLLREGRPLLSSDLLCSESHRYKVRPTLPCDESLLPRISRPAYHAQISALRGPLHQVSPIQST
jgi:hypothetical protein